MKKTVFNIIFVGLISIMLFPLCASAKEISTLETSETKGKITVSGTTETDVLAIATLVYSGDDLVYMETCEASDEEYSCTLNKTFDKGEYLIKVADYDGGEYITDTLSVTSTIKKTNNNPKTGDTIMDSIILGSISLIGLVGVGLYIKKRNI